VSDLRLHHVAVVVRDVERSLAFYRDFLGLPTKPRPPFTVGGAWLAAGPLEVHLVAHPGGTFRTGPCDTDDGHFACNTADFEGFLKRAVGLGYSEEAVGDDPMRMIVRRNSAAGYRQAYLLDPDRNIVEVNEAPSAF
jgi:catechol 2,3-dioxygenase-like lactoylglutathione lyase family enzyme